MSAGGVDLSTVRSQREALDRLPLADDLVRLGQRMGLWTGAAHEQHGERRAFPANLSQVSDAELADWHGYWASEMGRLTELAGVYNGVLAALRVEGRYLRSRKRSELRRQRLREVNHGAADGTPVKPYSNKDELEDDVHASREVSDHDQLVAQVETLRAQVEAAREATDWYLRTISREIAMRDRVYQSHAAPR